MNNEKSKYPVSEVELMIKKQGEYKINGLTLEFLKQSGIKPTASVTSGDVTISLIQILEQYVSFRFSIECRNRSGFSEEQVKLFGEMVYSVPHEVIGGTDGIALLFEIFYDRRLGGIFPKNEIRHKAMEMERESTKKIFEKYEEKTSQILKEILSILYREQKARIQSTEILKKIFEKIKKPWAKAKLNSRMPVRRG